MAQLIGSAAVNVFLLSAAFLLDLIAGDPSWMPHPVVLIGKYISFLEGRLNKGSSIKRKVKGILLVCTTVFGTYVLTWGVVWLAFRLNYWLGLIVTFWFLATTLASKSLAQAGRGIYNLLAAGDLKAARQKVGWIVGRDTADLTNQEVVRATVETVAENIVDGITSPLFYALIGGLPLAMAYKAVNTLDSMVGYRNERFLDFGWAGARLDDLANYIPARITGVLLVVAALVSRLDYKNAVAAIRRDAKQHPSPNSGYAESAVAGALGVRLGGYNSYGGVISLRAYMGEPKQELAPQHIQATIRLMYLTGLFFLLGGIGVKLLLR